jgi:ankyrin repeat protein
MATTAEQFQTALDENDTVAFGQALAIEPALANQPALWTHPRGSRILFSPLFIAAAMRKNLDMVVALVEAGADVNNPCVYSDNPAVLAYLLDHGADPDGVVYAGGTALMMAAYHPNAEQVAICLDHGADPNWTMPQTGNTALHWLLAHAERDEPEAVKAARLLIQAGADVNARIHSGLDDQSITMQDCEPVVWFGGGETALHGAAGRGLMQLTAYLLEAGADPWLKTVSQRVGGCHPDDKERWLCQPIEGETPLELAEAGDHHEVAALLRTYMTA